MEKTAIRTPEGARAIIEYNRYVLYHLPQEYRCLHTVLKDSRKDLLTLMNFCKNNDPIIYKQKYSWFMWNNKLTGLRGKSTTAVSSRRFNLWCSIGVITKIEQKPWGEMTELNQRFVGKNFGKRPINTFTIYRYTTEKLKQMELRASELIKHRITAGNLSHDKLLGCGLDELAREVFPINSKRPFKEKVDDFNAITEMQEDLIDEKGYTDKEELCRALGWQRSKLDSILNVHRTVWKQIYDYHAPKKEEKEQYNLQSKSWIITRR